MRKRFDNEGTALPRGGLLLPSSLGPIQFGVVPETIKDTVETPEGVPTVFVVPKKLFSVARSVNLAEIEFPAYWNFFVQRKRTTVVCHPGQRELLTRVLSEALFGPERLDPSEFSKPPAFAPDLTKELAYFRTNRVTGKVMQVSDFVDFVEADRNGTARLSGGVQISFEDDRSLALVEKGRIRSLVSAEPPLPRAVDRTISSKRAFRRPVLGVSVIGSGHGFDPGNRTSGFVLWLGGRGVLVDPPVDALDWLAGYDVDPRQVDGLILTHCHADHDAGALQKLLQEGRITIYTTPTVLSSFVAKYSLLTGMDPKAFRQLFDYVPVMAGEPVNIHGASVTFRYSLHSIPCVGFEVTYRGKGLVYPSDTLNDPDVIRALRDAGTLSQERAKDLVNFPWHHQLVIHEAGIPPIHTPVAYLASLDDATKSRLLLVHVSRRTLPENSGLRIAPTGLENTVDLKAPRLPVEKALVVLDAMAKVDILAELPAARAADFLRCVHKESYTAGERVVEDGTPGDTFYVILSGHASVRKHGRELKVYTDFDYFGETALITGAPRVADVFAKTDLEVLAMDRQDFLYLLRDTDLPGRLVHLAKLRELPTWELLSTAPALHGLTANQKTQLQALMDPVVYKKGSLIGPDPVLISSGRVQMVEDSHAGPIMGRGGFAGDPDRFATRRAAFTQFRCQTRVGGYRMPTRALKAFFRKNPGVFMRLSNLWRTATGDPE
jgi:phosphoribosyl 1,2-cyclic phosphodiesterase